MRSENRDKKGSRQQFRTSFFEAIRPVFGGNMRYGNLWQTAYQIFTSGVSVMPNLDSTSAAMPAE